jgi:hypothetical protein
MRISKGSTTLGSKLLEDPIFCFGEWGNGGEEKRIKELVAAAKSVSDQWD